MKVAIRPQLVYRPQIAIKPQERTYQFVLSRYIMEHSEMTGVIVFGSQRTGKSSYAMQVLYDIYQDWNTVLDHIFFKLEDVVRFLMVQIKTGRIIPAFVWDDAGVYGSKQLYFTKRRLAEYLQNLFDVIGTAVKGVILTTPSPENLLKALRSYEFYRVKIVKHNQYYRRIAQGYKNVLLPSGTRYIRKMYRDYFDVRLPKDVYEEYIKIRKSYLDNTLDNLNEFLQEMALKGKIEKETLKNQIKGMKGEG